MHGNERKCKAWHNKACKGKTGNGMRRKGKASQDMELQGMTWHDMARQGKEIQLETFYYSYVIIFIHLWLDVLIVFFGRIDIWMCLS
jgi:hypothetical protein